MLDDNAFLTGGTGGYHTYRIPSALQIPDGPLLFFCEGRKNRGSDFAQIHMLLCRSDDGGQTWTDPSIVWQEGDEKDEISIGNPCPIHDRETDTVWLLFTRDNEAIFVTHSEDQGESWATPREITQEACPDNWVRHWTGPGRGLQWRSGRLLCPSYTIVRDADDTMRSYALISDDHGKTWQAGTPTEVPADFTAERFESGWWEGGFEWAGCECLAAELPNGELYMTVRNQVRYKSQKPESVKSQARLFDLLDSNAHLGDLSLFFRHFKGVGTFLRGSAALRRE